MDVTPNKKPMKGSCAFVWFEARVSLLKLIKKIIEIKVQTMIATKYPQKGKTVIYATKSN